MFTKSFVIWVVAELIGIFYPWLLLKAQNKGNQRYGAPLALTWWSC
jgi:hypothetical protein